MDAMEFPDRKLQRNRLIAVGSESFFVSLAKEVRLTAFWWLQIRLHTVVRGSPPPFQTLYKLIITFLRT